MIIETLRMVLFSSLPKSPTRGQFRSLAQLYPANYRAIGAARCNSGNPAQRCFSYVSLQQIFI
jgi:hypothetical protein